MPLLQIILNLNIQISTDPLKMGHNNRNKIEWTSLSGRLTTLNGPLYTDAPLRNYSVSPRTQWINNKKQYTACNKNIRPHKNLQFYAIKTSTILRTVFRGCRHNLSFCACFLVPTSTSHHIHNTCRKSTDLQNQSNCQENKCSLSWFDHNNMTPCATSQVHL